MVGICSPDRYDNMSGLDVELRAERFLNPELLKGDLAAAFYLAFIFSAFFLFYFNGAFRAAMLKFYLRPHGPSFSEIITEKDNHMRQVKTSVAFRVFVILRIGISQIIVTEEIPAVNRLAISPDG